MSTKNIERIIPPGERHFVGDGFRVVSFIPEFVPMSRMNPIIMMDYNSPFYFSPTEKPRGVSVHPHRGFETVTIAYKGKVAHHDSHGGGGIINEGDVQWMTAASGVLHKEYHEKEFARQGGEFQMVQLWVNLPAKYKMSTPKYQAISNSSIPKVKHENGGVIEIIAGEYNQIKGAASTFTPVNLLNVTLNQGADLEFNFPARYNTCLIVVEGGVTINGSAKAPADHFVLMANDGEIFKIKAVDNAKVLVLSGEPINEPIASYGPFVMNTRQELIQANEDYQNGKFGHLED